MISQASDLLWMKWACSFAFVPFPHAQCLAQEATGSVFVDKRDFLPPFPPPRTFWGLREGGSCPGQPDG